MRKKKTYKQYDPNQDYLLAPRIKDWLPEGHLVKFLSDLVNKFDLTEITSYYERSRRGQPPYDPKMIVKVLLYSYCSNIFSSREIGKMLHENVAFRMLAAENFPDFRTISDFRKIHINSLRNLFVQVVVHCKVMGLIDGRSFSVDGTKIRANASMSKSYDLERLKAEEKKAREVVEKALQNAQSMDKKEDELFGERTGDELPEELRTQQKRLDTIETAIALINELKDAEEQENKKKEAERKRKEAREAKKGLKLRGRKPKSLDEKMAKKPKRNITDPDSRIMKTQKGFLQGHNAQIVTTEGQIIVAAEVFSDENDINLGRRMYEQSKANTGMIPEKFNGDAGYFKELDLNLMAEETELFVATTKSYKLRQKLKENGPPKGRIKKDATFREKMERKLLTKKGHKAYSRRAPSVEPPFGQIKENRGFTRFRLRGNEKVNGEWALVTMSQNILKMWRTTKNCMA
jgi:transposase